MIEEELAGTHVCTDDDRRQCACGGFRSRGDLPWSPELSAQNPLSIDGPDEADYLDGW